MAAQLIARFFRYFPAHEEPAFDSLVDLCESVDVDVRKHATMAMIAICRDCKHFVSKAADILIQLYQTNEASEVNLINQSLMTLLNLDIQKFLQSFFTNFEDGTEIVRTRALKFLSTKIQVVAESSLTKEVEEQLLSYSKKAMEDVTKDEFITFISILTKLKIAKSATGQAMIFAVIKSQADLDKDFDLNDLDSLDKFLLCTRHTIPLLSQYNRASEYVHYICSKILPHLSTLASSGNDLNVLQALAEMSPFIHLDDVPAVIDLEKCQRLVYEKLLEFLPLGGSKAEAVVEPKAGEKQESEPMNAEPQGASAQEPSMTDADAKPSTAVGGDSEKVQESASKTEVSPASTAVAKPAGVEQQKKLDVDFQFTHIEYLMFALHQFGRFRPEFFTEVIMTSLTPRLLNLDLGCKKYMAILSAQLRDVKSGEDLKKEENKLRSIALRTTKNIDSLIMRDLLKKPPQFKTTVLLSCKPLAATATSPIDTSDASSKALSANNGHRQQHQQQANKGQQNNTGNKSNYNRQGGQKHKYRQSYNDRNNKRPRHARY